MAEYHNAGQNASNPKIPSIYLKGFMGNKLRSSCSHVISEKNGQMRSIHCNKHIRNIYAIQITSNMGCTLKRRFLSI